MDDARMQSSIVLIVDDDPRNSARCEALIESLGATACLASSMAEVEAVLAIVIPDAIVVAYELPDATGIEVVSALRKRRALRRTPAIMVADEVPTNELERAVMAGIYASISKPVNAGSFKRLVAAAIAEDGRHTRKRHMDHTRKV